MLPCAVRSAPRRGPGARDGWGACLAGGCIPAGAQRTDEPHGPGNETLGAQGLLQELGLSASLLRRGCLSSESPVLVPEPMGYAGELLISRPFLKLNILTH